MYGRNRVAPEKTDAITVLFCLFLIATTGIGVVMLVKIYGIYNEVHRLRYVGATKGTLENRLKDHLYQARKGGRGRRCCGIRAMFCQELTPTIELFTEVGEYKWEAVERIYIKHFNDLGYNLWNETEGGEGTAGYVYTEKDKQKISMLGKKRYLRPEEHIKSQKALTSKKRKVIAQKVRKYRLGKHHSETTKAQTSCTLMGHPFYGNKYIKQ